MIILITAIGSMSAEAAIKSFRKLGQTTIIGCDIHPADWLSTSALVDVFHQIPRTDDEDYISTIISLSNNYSVNFIIPLTDPEVDILSSHRFELQNQKATVSISNPRAIEICRDKLKMYNFFKKSTLVKTIPTYTKQEIYANPILPLIAKPRNGRSSEGVQRIGNLASIELMGVNSENYIFQPIIRGEVITVDYVRSKHEKDISIPRKELLRTSNGAGLTVEVFNNENISKIASEIGNSLDVVGCINMEFINDGKDFLLMDINPRFSAGIAFSILAGYDVCINHLKAFMRKEIEDFTVRDSGIFIKKYVEVKSKNSSIK